jgi:Predicted membrane-associated, metal-dependent hydrolase
MNNLRNLIAERKWSFVLIYFVLLFNPIFYFWADDVNLKDKTMAWLTVIVVGLALCCIDLFLKKKGERFFLSVLLLLSIAPNLLVWGYLYVSNLHMRRDMFWVIFTTHTSETKEYIGQFISWQIILVGFVYILVGILFIVKAWSRYALPIRKYWGLFTFSILIVLASIIFQYLIQAIPTFDFYKSRVLYSIENQIFQNEKELRENLKMNVQCILPDSINHTFVVILGESTTSCHMSLYGYFRETTPFMDAQRGELDVYTDVVTPDTHTFGVMQKVLTFANHDHPEYFRQKPSMVEMFNSAGFETYWISNKAFLTKWGGSYGIIAEEAKHLYDLSAYKQPDEVVVPFLEKIINDSIQGNKIIFIHLMGNHHAYNSRYPKNFAYFDHEKRDDLGADFRDNDMKETIDEYDNSILYGDFVFNAILEQVKKIDNSSFLLFFPDHGEEVYDFRDARGHFMKNVYPCQCQIPFVLWRSEVYREEVPSIVIDTSRPYSIENVIYSISTLSGLKYEGNDQKKSIFSTEYKIPEKRLVGEEDYDRKIIHKLD